MARLALLLLLVPAAYATLGLDAIDTYSTGTFNCLSQNGYSFFIARVGRTTGTVDATGIANIKNARAAGWKYVDGYIFPCSSGCSATPAQQVQNAIDKLKSEGATVGMLWLDIEIYKWSSDKTANQNVIRSMANTLDANGVNWGIYTNPNNWENIVGLDWAEYKGKQLWWANYNHKQDLTSNWKNFGGWTKPNIHQFEGDVKGPCSVSLDNNYY